MTTGSEAMIEACIATTGNPLSTSRRKTGWPAIGSGAFRKTNRGTSTSPHMEVLVPLGQRRRLVVGNAVGLSLGRGQPKGDMNRNRLQAELEGGLVSGVPDDDDALL